MAFIRPERAVRIVAAACTACGTCVETCPMDVLRLHPATGKAHVAYGEDCQVCFVCQFDCPVEAVRVSARGWPDLE